MEVVVVQLLLCSAAAAVQCCCLQPHWCRRVDDVETVDHHVDRVVPRPL